MSSLAAAIVSFHSDADQLGAAIHGLAVAVAAAALPTHLTLVDNSAGASDAARIDTTIEAARAQLQVGHPLTIERMSTGANLGYGVGNNRALLAANQNFVLVLNPDAILAPDALQLGLEVFKAYPDCTLVAPRAFDEDGHDLHLGHGFPTLLALAGRSLPALQRFERVRNSMARYELRELDVRAPHAEIICASGCCMLMPKAAWQACRGFDPAFFLYFEDYDLTLRLRRLGAIRYAPQIRLTHLGGDASGKGWRHTRMFIVSAARFFRRHGLRWS